jgi:hypothetical protein
MSASSATASPAPTAINEDTRLTDGDTVDRRHDRRVAIDHRAHDVARLLHHPDGLRVVAHLFGDPVEITAGGERRAGAGDDDRTYRGVLVDRPEHLRQLQVHVGAGGVESIRIVECDQQHAVGRSFEAQVRVPGVRVGSRRFDHDPNPTQWDRAETLRLTRR